MISLIFNLKKETIQNCIALKKNLRKFCTKSRDTLNTYPNRILIDSTVDFGSTYNQIPHILIDFSGKNRNHPVKTYNLSTLSHIFSLLTMPMLREIFIEFVCKRSNNSVSRYEHYLLFEYNNPIRKDQRCLVFESKEDKLLEELVWCSWILLGLDYSKRNRNKRSAIREFWELFVLDVHLEDFDESADVETNYAFLDLIYTKEQFLVYCPYFAKNTNKYVFNKEDYDIDLQVIEIPIDINVDCMPNFPYYNKLEDKLINNNLTLPVLPFNYDISTSNKSYSLTAIYQELFYEIYINNLHDITPFKNGSFGLVKNMQQYFNEHLNFSLTNASLVGKGIYSCFYYNLTENLVLSKEQKFLNDQLTTLIKNLRSEEDDLNYLIFNKGSYQLEYLNYFGPSFGNLEDDRNDDVGSYFRRFLGYLCYPLTEEVFLAFNKENIYTTQNISTTKFINYLLNAKNYSFSFFDNTKICKYFTTDPRTKFC